MLVREVLNAKATHEVVTIGPSATVRQLLDTLAEHNVGALIVSPDGIEVDGIVSERDIVRKLNGGAALDEPISNIMTSDVRSCTPDDELTELMQTMTEYRIRHLPVLEAGALVGIVSIGDVVKYRIVELEFERDQLEGYVHQT